MVAYTIRFRPTALRDMKTIPPDVRRRIAKKIDSLVDDPRPPGVEKLSGTDDDYRVRVGDYRILFKIQDEVLLVIVVKIGHRREVYRR